MRKSSWRRQTTRHLPDGHLAKGMHMEKMGKERQVDGERKAGKRTECGKAPGTCGRRMGCWKEWETHTLCCGGKSREEDLLRLEQMKERIRKLEKELFLVWDYIGQEGCWGDAREYVVEHGGDEIIPFESLP